MRKTEKRGTIPPPARRAPIVYSLEMSEETKFAPTGEFHRNKKGEVKEKLLRFRLGKIRLLADGRAIEETNIVRKTNFLKIKKLRERFARLCGPLAAKEFDAFAAAISAPAAQAAGA